MLNNFCAFILTHGRPDGVITYKSLKNSGYTGKIYLVIDNEDKEEARYKELFGDQVIQFDKLAISKRFDTGDNFTDRRTIVYARNACFEIAKSLGIDYFIELDDDYTQFAYKFNNERQYRQKRILNLDKVFDTLLDYYKRINALTIAFAQGGDFLGGRNSEFGKSICTKRKAMNTFICSTDRPFTFVGRINEDVNTYTSIGGRGGLFLTLNIVGIQQKTTQASSGGMTGVYLDNGTYLKSFYTVMYNPSSVKISVMGEKHRRLHHKINWNATVPKIIRDHAT